MTDPQIAVFRAAGTWRKPPGAETVDMILVGAQSSDGNEGEAVLRTFSAAELPETFNVTGGGSAGDGLAVVITRFTDIAAAATKLAGET
jgi:hypothetical protein